MYKVKILKIKKLTHDVVQITTEKPANYSFTPGQATDVVINEAGWKDKKRPFTYTSLNAEPDLRFTIKTYPKTSSSHDGVTEAIGKLKSGDELLVGDPWGAIRYKGKGVFIAGGAGITPFLAIFRDLHKKGKLKGNKLIFSNKTKKDVILENELRKYFADEDLILILTREDVKDYVDDRIDREFLQKQIKDFRQQFYICGPRKMVQEITKTLQSLGANPDSVVFEK